MVTIIVFCIIAVCSTYGTMTMVSAIVAGAIKGYSEFEGEVPAGVAGWIQGISVGIAGMTMALYVLPLLYGLIYAAV